MRLLRNAFLLSVGPLLAVLPVCVPAQASVGSTSTTVRKPWIKSPWSAVLVDENGGQVDSPVTYTNVTQDVDWSQHNQAILHPLGSWDFYLHVGYPGGGAPDEFRFAIERP